MASRNKSNSFKEPQVRGEKAREKILEVAIRQVLEVGFRNVSVESVAAEAKIGKTTIYRRWPNKSALIMDAFMIRIGSNSVFPAATKALDRVKRQMKLMAKTFSGKEGALIKSLLSEAQFDVSLATELRERWTLPRREMATSVFKDAIKQKEVRPNIDIAAVIDILYGPIYYRLQMGTGPLNESYVDEIFSHVIEGLKAH